MLLIVIAFRCKLKIVEDCRYGYTHLSVAMAFRKESKLNIEFDNYLHEILPIRKIETIANDFMKDRPRDDCGEVSYHSVPLFQRVKLSLSPGQIYRIFKYNIYVIIGIFFFGLVHRQLYSLVQNFQMKRDRIYQAQINEWRLIKRFGRSQLSEQMTEVTDDEEEDDIIGPFSTFKEKVLQYLTSDIGRSGLVTFKERSPIP